MPLQSTSGAASYDAFGGGVPVVPKYIEEYFSTFLYSGTGSAQTITNGIDLSTKGGLVWIKSRSATYTHRLFDTNRGATKFLVSNDTLAEDTNASTLTAFTSSGFSVGASTAVGENGTTYASWTLAKAPKFFDVVTYTGDGTTANTIAHSLGSTPGCIIIKPLTDASFNDWRVWHRSLTSQSYQLKLNTTDAQANVGNFISQDSTTFTVGYTGANQSGISYVAYLFAHDAGGFGLTGTDNVISCGSYTGNGSTTGPVITLGYEPQWLMVKKSSGAGDWVMLDNMRGIVTDGIDPRVWANLSSAENTGDFLFKLNATGFQPESLSDSINASSQTYIYIAIRRGPMKVPTSGTSVYNAVSRTGTGTAATITGIGFAPDLLDNQRTSAGSYTGFFDRLRGAGKLLYRALDDAETTVANQTTQFNTTMDGFAVGSSTASDSGNSNTVPYIWHCYKRAPSVFDIVCYTGNGSTQNVNHNLGVAPELMIVKSRSLSGSDWWVYASPLTTPQNKYLRLQSTGGESTVSGLWGSSLPTSTTFGLGAFAPNSNGATFVAYLFATCAGVSKVGSYTGTGALQTVNCGFAAGSRFILIKRTDSTGDWYVYDSTRGITSGNDPYLLWNTTGAEVTGTDYINTASVGFQVTATAPAGLNASGGTYIFLAIA